MDMNDNVSPARNEERSVTQDLYPASVVKRKISSAPDMRRCSTKPISEDLRAAKMDRTRSNRHDLHP